MNRIRERGSFESCSWRKRSKNFRNFFIRQLFPFRRVICTGYLFSFVTKNRECSRGEGNKFRFPTKSGPEMEWLDTRYASRSTAGKYRFCEGPLVNISNKQTRISSTKFSVDLHHNFSLKNYCFIVCFSGLVPLGYF